MRAEREVAEPSGDARAGAGWLAEAVSSASAPFLLQQLFRVGWRHLRHTAGLQSYLEDKRALRSASLAAAAALRSASAC